MTYRNNQRAVELLHGALSDPRTSLGVKVMCALLKYNVPMSLSCLIKTKYKPAEHGRVDVCYDGSCFFIGRTKMDVAEDFNAYLRTLDTAREYLVTDPQGKRYLQGKRLNTACEELFGHDYMRMQTVFLDSPVAEINNKGQSNVAPVSDTKPNLATMVKPVQVSSADPPKGKLKLKLKKAARVSCNEQRTLNSKARPWTDYNDPLIRESSNLLQHRNVKLLVYHLVGKDDQFYHGAFETPEALGRIKLFLESPNAERGGKTYALETQANFVNALCKFLYNTHEFNVVMYDKYCHYRDELKAKNLLREKPAVVEFTALVPRLAEIVADESKAPGFRVVCSMIVNNMNLSDNLDETPGVLRMSDLLHTRMQDDKDHSFMDLANKLWHIKSKYTKNKMERTIVLPDNFVADIKRIYPFKVSDWLLTKKSGKPYETVASLTSMFRDYAGVNFTDIRASYATYRHSSNVSTVGDMKKLCRTMGHSMNTVQHDYLRFERK